MHRRYLKAIGYGCVVGVLTALASIAYALHRSFFPTPFNRSLDWVIFPLCPPVLLGYVPMPHLTKFFTLTMFEILVVILNAAIYSILFVIITLMLRKTRQQRNQNEVANEI
jgi:hypothetical protein